MHTRAKGAAFIITKPWVYSLFENACLAKGNNINLEPHKELCGFFPSLYAHDYPISQQIHIEDSGVYYFAGSLVDSTTFLSGASKYLGFPVKTRTSDVKMSSLNFLSNGLVFPPAKLVDSFLSLIIHRYNSSISATNSVAAKAHVFFALYHAILTLHPLLDCNGRISRRLFYELVMFNSISSPVVLASILELHRRRLHHYHSVAWLSRNGDHLPLLELFNSCLQDAERLFLKVNTIQHALEEMKARYGKAIM